MNQFSSILRVQTLKTHFIRFKRIKPTNKKRSEPDSITKLVD